MPREQLTEVLAEMVANVMSVAVAPGDAVAVGDTVVLLESMKMEIPVLAEVALHSRQATVELIEPLRRGCLLPLSGVRREKRSNASLGNQR